MSGFQFSEEDKASLAKGIKEMHAGPDSWSGYEIPSWSKMRSVLETRVIATISVWLIVVPIFLSFTSKLPPTLSAFPFGSEQELLFVLDIPFNWYLLYFSAAFFALARLLYIVGCPEFIRKYGSSASASSDGVTAELVRDYASDYLAERGDRKLNRGSPEGERLNSFLNEITGQTNLVGRHWDGAPKQKTLQSVVAGTHVREIPGTGTYLRSFKRTGEEDEDQKRLTSLLLWKFIDWLDHARYLLRASILALLILGFTLFLIPFCQGFLLVVNSFFENAL